MRQIFEGQTVELLFPAETARAIVGVDAVASYASIGLTFSPSDRNLVGASQPCAVKIEVMDKQESKFVHCLEIVTQDHFAPGQHIGEFALQLVQSGKLDKEIARAVVSAGYGFTMKAEPDLISEDRVEQLVERYLTHGVLGDAANHKNQLCALVRELEQEMLTAQADAKKSQEASKVGGFVFAFPELESEGRDELLEALREGGNTVVAVYGEHAQAVLREANTELAGDDNEISLG